MASKTNTNFQTSLIIKLSLTIIAAVVVLLLELNWSHINGPTLQPTSVVIPPPPQRAPSVSLPTTTTTTSATAKPKTATKGAPKTAAPRRTKPKDVKSTFAKRGIVPRPGTAYEIKPAPSGNRRRPSRRVVSVVTTPKEGVRHRIGRALDGGQWPQAEIRELKETDKEPDLALIDRVDHMTYTLLHASVYSFIGIDVALIVSHVYGEYNSQLESTLMLAGVVLHVVAFLCVSASTATDSHHVPTALVTLLMLVLIVLMLADCAVVWRGEKKPKKRPIKPKVQNNTPEL